jgi:hypothetical protein
VKYIDIYIYNFITLLIVLYTVFVMESFHVECEQKLNENTLIHENRECIVWKAVLMPRFMFNFDIRIRWLVPRLNTRLKQHTQLP